MNKLSNRFTDWVGADSNHIFVLCVLTVLIFTLLLPSVLMLVFALSLLWLWLALNGLSHVLKQEYQAQTLHLRPLHGLPDAELSVKQQGTSNDD